MAEQLCRIIIAMTLVMSREIEINLINVGFAGCY